jgi:manganese/zinc/iron transport system permease protein
MIEFFTDPVLRAPTLGCIFMSIASSLMGVCIFFRKRSLLSESLSHAAYPGACVGIAVLAYLFPSHDEWAFLAVLLGAFFSALLGLKAIDWLELKGKVHADTALCFALATFFGIGIVFASAMQIHLPVWYKQVQMILFGQAATMVDLHVWIYGSLAFCIAFFLFMTFRPLQALLFDKDFSASAKIPAPFLEKMIFWLLLLSLIVGMRSVGVVLMSGMVIAPAVAARSFSEKLKTVFYLSAFFGAISAFLGNVFAVSFHLPTGPAIVLVGTAFALASLLLAPKRGLFFRFFRIARFRLRCAEENILKGIWKKGECVHTPTFLCKLALWNLRRSGWVDSSCRLTVDGKKKAARIIRLHRLWELYLAESLGMSLERVHHTAEEMEHILTHEMEEKLTHLLENPTTDPHDQPIPERHL